MKDKQNISLEKVVWVSFIVDVSDVVMNVTIALLTGSVTMLSQALEGVADLLSSTFLLIGVKQSKRPADSNHPFGYGREIYFWSFLAGLASFLIAATFSFYWGLLRFLNPEPIEHLPWTFIALGIALCTNGYAFSLSYRRLLGDKGFKRIWQSFIHSAFIETKTAFIQDLMGTIASLFGIIALTIYVLTGDYRYDGIGAMAVGVVLAFFAVFILKGAKALLLGQSASPEMQYEIIQAAEKFDEVKEVLDLRTIFVGPEMLLVTLELHLIDALDTDKIEMLTDEIEKQIMKQVPEAKHIQIELETPDV